MHPNIGYKQHGYRVNTCRLASLLPNVLPFGIICMVRTLVTLPFMPYRGQAKFNRYGLNQPIKATNGLKLTLTFPCNQSRAELFLVPLEIKAIVDGTSMKDRPCKVSDSSSCNFLDYCEQYLMVPKWSHAIGIGFLTTIGNKLILSNGMGNRLVIVDENGNTRTIGGEKSSEPGKFNEPVGTAVHDNLFYQAEFSSKRVQVFTENFDYKSMFKTSYYPIGMAYHDGHLYIADFYEKIVHIHKLDGTEVGKIGSGILKGPYDVVWTKNGTMIVSDLSDKNLKMFSETGELLHASKEVDFLAKQIDVDSYGHTIVTDTNVNKLHVFDSSLNHVCENYIPFTHSFGIAVFPNCSLVLSERLQVHTFKSPLYQQLTSTKPADISTDASLTAFDVTTSAPAQTSEPTAESTTQGISPSVNLTDVYTTIFDLTTSASASAPTSEPATESTTPGVSPTVNPTEKFCPDNWFKHDDNCYIWSHEESGWFGAEKKCQKWGGHLVSVTSADENVFAHSLSQCRDEFWLGLVLTESEIWTNNSAWQWWDGSKHDYSKLRINSTKKNAEYENCVFQSSNGDYWVHENCRTENKFICKSKASHKQIMNVEKPCPEGWKSYDSNCYWLSNEKVNYFHAQLSCQEKNSTVVTIHSEGEQVFNQILHGCNEKVWIGLEHTKPCLSSDKGKCWEWIDLSQIKYTKWLPGNPGTISSNECVFNDGGWIYTSCDNSFKYICKKLR